MSRKGSQSTTQQTSNTAYTDQSANAAEGGIAAGAGATVNIENLSEGVALGALESNQNVAGMALAAQQNTALGSVNATRDVAGMALAAQQNTSIAALQTNQNVAGMALDTASRAITENRNVADIAITANRDVNLRSLDTTSRLAETAINTVVGLGEVASRERIDTLESANLAITSAQGSSDKFAQLASAALERSQTPDSAVTKQLLWVVGGVAALVVLVLFSRKSKSAA